MSNNVKVVGRHYYSMMWENSQQENCRKGSWCKIVNNSWHQASARPMFKCSDTLTVELVAMAVFSQLTCSLGLHTEGEETKSSTPPAASARGDHVRYKVVPGYGPVR